MQNRVFGAIFFIRVVFLAGYQRLLDSTDFIKYAFLLTFNILLFLLLLQILSSE